MCTQCTSLHSCAHSALHCCPATLTPTQRTVCAATTHRCIVGRSTNSQSLGEGRVRCAGITHEVRLRCGAGWWCSGVMVCVYWRRCRRFSAGDAVERWKSVVRLRWEWEHRCIIKKEKAVVGGKGESVRVSGGG
jgi:hypothetical protein